MGENGATRVKILYLCPDAGVPVLGRKGASVHVRELVSAFSRSGHNVILAAQLLNKSPWEPSEDLQAKLLHVRLSGNALAAVLALKEFNAILGVENGLPGELRRILYNKELEAELKRRLDSDPPDFIYERASLYGTAGISLARELNVPLVLELNAPLAMEQSAYRATGLGELAGKTEAWVLGRADAVLTVSAPLREHVISRGIDSAKVHVFPNGVNPVLFQPGPRDPNLRTRWGVGDDLVLGFLGGLRPWHGVEVLPELLERLVPRFGALRLVIAGDGQLRPLLEGLLRQRGLEDHAVFIGSVAHGEVAAVIRQFDVALAPYPKLDHPFYFSPLKLFEYMACGVAVVAADLGQIAEVVEDGKTGLTYPAGNLDALAAACERLLLNPKLRQTLGQAASESIHRQCTWDQNAERVVDLARRLIAARRNPTKSQEP